MNANFRRDYLYQFKTGAFSGISLRYLNFDKKTKEYCFIEGDSKQDGELLIRVKRADYIKGRIKRLFCIGYGNTNQYLSRDSRMATKREKNILEIKSLFITKFDNLELGKNYKFSGSNVIDTSQVMTLNRFDRYGTAVFGIKTDPEYQLLNASWLDNGKLTCELVG